MITGDPQQRAARLQELTQALERVAQERAPEDRELLLAFAPLVYDELPDRLTLGLPMDVLAARVYDHFRFVIREMPPPHQLYKGLPGIHVVARNLAEPEAVAL